jgi:undecaprenyl-phosphate 4-deoxy-4-formamido-L-arabinose transferase
MPEKISESISLVIPVKNERNLLESTVRRCIKTLSRDFTDFELILIDDGSTDGTGDMMDELAKHEERIHVLHNNINLNVGISVQCGMAVATKDFVVHNAVDLPLSVEDIARSIHHMKDCDILVLERKSYSGYTLWRWITSKVNRLLLRVMFGRNDIHDMNFTQIYRRDIMQKLFPIARSPAFTTPEMILRAQCLGLRVKSVMVDYQPRTVGKGAFGKPHDILWSLYDMLRFRLKVWKKLSRDSKT